MISNKLEIMILRMRDLKTILIQVKYNDDLFEYTNSKIYINNITDIGSDISILHNVIIGSKQKLNLSRIQQNLETLATTLSHLENKLKHKKYDT